MTRDDELRLIENYPVDKVSVGPPAFCAVSLQSELSERKREFEHSNVKRKWKWPNRRVK